MGYILGIHGFSADSKRILHDTGVSLVKDGDVIAAINEERFSRKKNDGAFPWESLEYICKTYDLNSKNVDCIAFSDEKPLWQLANITKMILDTYFETGIFLSRYLIESIMRTRDFFRRPPDNFRDVPVKFVEHHKAHAASAYFSSPWKDSTIITIDGMGDYCIGGTISKGEDGELKVLKRTNGFYSPGIFYMIVTDYLGFKPGRHEGKIMGMAAFGNPEVAYNSMSELICYDRKSFNFYSKPIPDALNKFSLLNDEKGDLDFFEMTWRDFTATDIASAAQKRLEDTIIPFIEDAISLTGISYLTLAGGIFANVKLNKRISNLPCVENVYIHPNMGDGGLATGAAFHVCYHENMKTGFEGNLLENIYLGPDFSDKIIEKELKTNKLEYRTIENVEKKVAQALSNKKIIGHFFGKMEYGPRALGNRSIFANPLCKEINNELNNRLERTEFMPFAPAIMEEYANDYLLNWTPAQIAARFMTLVYDATSLCTEKAPAIVHVDGTTRPQVVRKMDNPRLHSIIKHFCNITGVPLIINTSFNLHEEPIICSPLDAIKAFKENACDVLVLNNFWVEHYD